MDAEEETQMQTDTDTEPVTKQETPVASSSGTNENFVVLDMAGDSEDSDKEEKSIRDGKEREVKDERSEMTGKSAPLDPETAVKPSSATGGSVKPRLRTKPKAPVVDVTSLRKRKWQLKVYPLHAEDLQLTYTSILCKLASESLLYIPSEGRHGKAELYVATQKETAAIIGKLLRMDFHHKLLSIEVVRKDTGGKEDGDDSKKECKAFLMFDKFLSKKIFDAKGEKGMLVEKTVTLNKVPKAATKDFIGALFPFATEIEIIESEDPDERKATVRCKTPVTSLLVYKSFKRLEINDVHVKLSVDDSVKAISLPPVFFLRPTEHKSNMGPPEAGRDMMNQNSMGLRRPIPPMMNSLNRRVQQLKKRALLTRRKPLRGELMMNERPGGPGNLMDGPRRGSLLGRPMMRRPGDGPGLLNRPGPGMRDMPMGPGRRRMNDRMPDRRRDRDSNERKGRRDEEDSTVTKEMLQLQNQLNQAIKNQIAMLNTSGSGGPMRGSDNFQGHGGSGPRTSLLGQGPRNFSGGDMGASSTPGRMDHQSNFGSGGTWSGDRGNRMDHRNGPGAGDRNRPDRMARSGPLLGSNNSSNLNRSGRSDRGSDRGNKRMESGGGPGGRSDSRGGDNRRTDRGDRDRRAESRSSAGNRSGGFVSGGGDAGGRVSKTDSHRSGPDSARANSRGRRPEFAGANNSSSNRSTPRNEQSYSAGGSNRYSGDYSNQNEGNGSYYRRY